MKENDVLQKVQAYDICVLFFNIHRTIQLHNLGNLFTSVHRLHMMILLLSRTLRTISVQLYQWCTLSYNIHVL